MAVFQAAELLIPRRELLENWAVIACDQFTSQPDYWRAVREQVMEKPSAYHIVFPEAELRGDRNARIASINETMRRYLDEDVFETYPDAFVFVKRTLQDGSVRRGVVGVIDLEQYDFASDAQSSVRATEQTVVERIPPRVRVRSGAAMETSHVLLLMDDAESTVLDKLEESEEELPIIYSFELMQGGGPGAAAEALGASVGRYEIQTAARFAQMGKAPLLYAVGDGNHSLATAKTCWEALKAQRPELAGTHHPARYAMVELQNIRDESQKFEPIHRLLIDVPVERLLEKITSICAPGGTPVDWQAGERQGMIFLNTASGALPVAVLQPFLDAFLKEQGGAIDYIHGEETAAQLAGQKKAISFLMPNISKEDFFRGIVMDGVLPRKTFSMGHAQEKRYYLECRKITE